MQAPNLVQIEVEGVHRVGQEEEAGCIENLFPICIILLRIRLTQSNCVTE